MGRIIAMWSGPRNISTAMMRAWENRTDTSVWDEPLYACFLDRTGLDHPGRERILADHAHERSYDAVVDRLVREPEEGIFYQKHIAHHLLEDMDQRWIDDARMTHCFLIRDPREVILSLHRRYPAMELRDTGFPQLLQLFRRQLDRRAGPPPVLDARDVLQDPGGMLEALCHRLEIPFEDRMISWPPGARESDGAWAPWWYDSVEASTGFSPWRPREGTLPRHLQTVLEHCRPMYEELKAHSIEV